MCFIGRCLAALTEAHPVKGKLAYQLFLGQQENCCLTSVTAIKQQLIAWNLMQYHDLSATSAAVLWYSVIPYVRRKYFTWSLHGLQSSLHSTYIVTIGLSRFDRRGWTVWADVILGISDESHSVLLVNNILYFENKPFFILSHISSLMKSSYLWPCYFLFSCVLSGEATLSFLFDIMFCKTFRQVCPFFLCLSSVFPFAVASFISLCFEHYGTQFNTCSHLFNLADHKVPFSHILSPHTVACEQFRFHCCFKQTYRVWRIGRSCQMWLVRGDNKRAESGTESRSPVLPLTRDTIQNRTTGSWCSCCSCWAMAAEAQCSCWNTLAPRWQRSWMKWPWLESGTYSTVTADVSSCKSQPDPFDQLVNWVLWISVDLIVSVGVFTHSKHFHSGHIQSKLTECHNVWVSERFKPSFHLLIRGNPLFMGCREQNVFVKLGTKWGKRCWNKQVHRLCVIFSYMLLKVCFLWFFFSLLLHELKYCDTCI